MLARVRELYPHVYEYDSRETVSVLHVHQCLKLNRLQSSYCLVCMTMHDSGDAIVHHYEENGDAVLDCLHSQPNKRVLIGNFK